MQQKEHRKGLAALIIAHGKKPEEGSAAEEAQESPSEEAGEDESKEPMHDEGKQHAVNEMMEAFHAKDHASLKAALENFIDMHK